MKRSVLIGFFLLAGFSFQASSFAAAEGTNKAAVVLCDIVLFIRGRYGRAIAVIAVMSTSWGFLLGNISWQRVVALIVGFSLMFGAEGFAFVILPSQIKGIEGVTASGFVFDRKATYTPQQLIKHVCPELVRM
jgi:type IV secretory pathway VirB2 component (pilin)